MGDIVPRKTLVKQGMKGLGGVGGGLAVLALTNIANPGSIPGLIVGGAIAAVGLAVSTSKDDRTAGLIVAGAGAATVLASLPFIGGIAGTLMLLSGFGLIGMGGVSLYKFLKGLKKNSR